MRWFVIENHLNRDHLIEIRQHRRVRYPTDVPTHDCQSQRSQSDLSLKMATHAHAKACRRSHQISWLTPSTRRCTQILMRLCVQFTRGTETFRSSVGWHEIGERMFQIFFCVPLSKSTVLCKTVFGTQVLHSTLHHACAKSEPEL